MKCPILMYNYLPEESPTKGKRVNCIKKECVWWDSMYGMCDPTGLAHTLERLTDILAEIERKMPYKASV